ncbi:sigma-54 interaction domain-containing protein [Brevibacillus fluminis]|uniref:sigma-54 interaction domain-containing protein n=1 Tax=Brevibacillus fluminis TaxID=511487 RepID=UPI003F8C113B
MEASLLTSIIEHSIDGIYVVDGNGITVLLNAAYEDMIGYRREQMVGRHVAELAREGFFDQSVSLLVLEQKKSVTMVQKIGGQKKDVLVTGNPVFAADGSIQLVVISVRDITYLNELKRELKKAKTIFQMQNHRYAVEIDGAEQQIVFQSQKMMRIYEKVQQVAPYPTGILLTGPSGAGKEVIANLVHHYSKREQQPFIKVNCGAIPEALLESELFGYEKGAFTGANREGKIGLLELADGGTVMLDEVGEMPMAIQVKLLRVIQEKQIMRIGGIKPRSLDIRIISATNQNLRELVRAGKFREDLYYRLNVVEIQIPPLEERQDDVPLLVHHFFSFFCKQYKVDKQLSDQARELLNSYHWPGNVRELRNTMENLVVSIPSSLIEPYDLPPHIFDQEREEFRSFSLKERVEQFEHRIIQEAIGRHASIRQAALQLGVDHSTLLKKMKRRIGKTKRADHDL